MYAAPPPPQVVVQPPPQVFVPPPPQVVVAPPVVVSAPPAVVSPLATVATVVAPQWQSFPRCAAIATLTLSLLAFLVGFGACFAEYVVLGEQGGSVQVLMFGWQACMRVPFYGYQCVAYASGDDYEQGSGMSLDFDDEYTRNLQLAFTLSILAEIFVLKNTIMTACSMCHARRGSTSCNGAISIGVVSCIATCFYLIALSLVASTSAKLHQDLGGATSLGGARCASSSLSVPRSRALTSRVPLGATRVPQAWASPSLPHRRSWRRQSWPTTSTRDPCR